MAGKALTPSENLSLALKNLKNYADVNKLYGVKDWYKKAKLKDAIDRVPRTRLNKLNHNIYELISMIYEGREPVHPWLFKKQLPNRYWQSKENRSSYMLWLKNELGIDNDLEMAEVTGKDLKQNYGGGIIHIMPINELLRESFPDLQISGKRPTGSKKRTPEENLDEAKRKLSELARERKIVTVNDWYLKLSLGEINNYIGSSLMSKIGLHPIDLIKSFHNTNSVYPWLFGMSPMGLWTEKENRTKYMRWLYRELDLSDLNGWYKVTRSDLAPRGGAGLLQSFKLSELIKEAFPYFKYNPAFAKKANQGITKNKNYQREFAEDALKESDIELTRDNLISLEEKVIRSRKGGAAILRNFDTFPDFLIYAFPEMELQKLDFNRKGRGFWENVENHKPAVDKMIASLGVKSKIDFYLIRCEDFEIHGLYRLLDFYSNSHIQCLLALYPELQLDPSKFNRVSALQERLFALCKSVFPVSEIYWNYKHPKMLFPDSKKKMEIDVFLPNELLGFELHGKQHREPIEHWGGESAFQKGLMRDEQKRKAARDIGIKLIEIHDNQWDGSIDGFVDILLASDIKDISVHAESLRSALKYELIDVQKKLSTNKDQKAKRSISVLSEEEILELCDDYHSFHGDWPKRTTREFADIDDQYSWKTINSWLVNGRVIDSESRSLPDLLMMKRGVKHHLSAEALTFEKILDWADKFYEEFHSWPNHKSGIIPDSGGETWARVRSAIVKNGRGLPDVGYKSLADLLEKERDVRSDKRGINSPGTSP